MKRRTTQSLLIALLLVASGATVGGLAYAGVAQQNQQKAPAKAKGVPGPVTNLSVTASDPREDGTADVTFKFTTPTQYYDDDSWDYADGLDELTSIAIYEQDANYQKQLVATIENPEMGVEMSYTIENVASGEHSYYIFSLNSESDDNINYNWDSYVYITVQVGYAAPDMVQNPKAVVDGSTVTITWDAPTGGVNGGVLNPDDPITYTVYRYSGYYSTMVTVAEGISETSCVDVCDFDELTSVYYSIIAVNSVGESYENNTANVAVGPAYTVPFEESFDGGYASKIWSSESSSSTLTASTYVSSWSGAYTGIDYQYVEESYDNDSGMLYFRSSSNEYADEEDTSIDYATAPISLKDAKAPGLSFYHYVLPHADNQIKTSVIIEKNGERNVVKSFDDYTQGEQGWQYVSIDLSSFVGDDEIKVIFHAESNSWKDGFAAFDKIVLDNVLENDLFLSDFSASSKVDAGENYTASATLFNKGSKTAEGYSVELYADDVLIDTKAGDAIESNNSAVITFIETADNSYNEKTVLKAKIVYAADQNAANDEAEATISVRKAETPAPTEASAVSTEGKIVLSWTAPDYSLPEFENAVEGFEDFADHAKTNDDFGNWTVYDDAAHYLIYLEYKGLDWEEWMDEQMSWTVLDQTSLNVTNSKKWYGKAHSGNKFLFSCSSLWGTRKDWLVSPELSGNAQTIEFYAVSNQFPTDKYNYDDDNTIKDQIFVYASFTDTEESSFTYVALANADDNTTGVEIQNALANGDDYQKFSVDLPEGAKYFAVVVYTPNSSDSMVFLDDFSFEQKQSGVQIQLLGYNVYENGQQLNDEPVADTKYTVENPVDGAVYTICAVYNVGNSEAVTAFAETGVNSLSTGSIRVFAQNGQLSILGAEAANVYDVAGRRVAQTRGDAQIALTPGAYIVRADNKTFKVLVK